MIKEALLTAKHTVNDKDWNLEFKMIAPPIYKCEVVTHNKSEGESRLRQAMSIIRKVMKENGGAFRQKSEPTIIGASKDEPDVADLIDSMKNRQDHVDEDIEENQDDDVDVEDEQYAEASSDEEEKKE